MIKRIIFILPILLAGNANAQNNDSDYYMPNNYQEETPQIIDYKLNDKHSFNISADVKPDYDKASPDEAIVMAKLRLRF